MTQALWLSDLHFKKSGLVQDRDPRQSLERATRFIHSHYDECPLIFLTGDICDDGELEDYRALCEMFGTSQSKLLPMVGNHDDRAALRRVFPLPDHAMTDFVQYYIEADEQLFVCLDTQKLGSSAGEFCKERQEWLKDLLIRAGTKPTYIFMHHPPLDLGLPMQDQENMENGNEFINLVSAFPCVKHLFMGHVHRSICGSVRGLGFSTMRSLLYQAPPPKPDWDWTSFSPADEAANIGHLKFTGGNVVMQYLQI